MAKIYIDTNVFIDIYQSSSDPVGVVDTIANYAAYLVVPDQTVNEFHRNRVGVLDKLAKDFGRSVDVKPWFSSLIKHLPGFQDLTAAADEFRAKARNILHQIEAARDPANDPVAEKVTELFSRSETTRIPLTDDLIGKAHRRKLLGNPPASPDKYTIGDEVIWEALLARVRDDLIVITRDRTFLTNEQILAREFRAATGRELLLVTTKVTEALKKLGEIPPPKLVEEEDRISEEEKCPQCGARGDFFGYEGSDGDEAAWFECRACGYMEFV